MIHDYDSYVETKRIEMLPSGFDINLSMINPAMSGRWSFQADILRWNLRRGRSADFLDCGLGKSAIECEFAYHVSRYADAPVLVIAPLGVSMQLRKEFSKFGRDSRICKSQDDIGDGINITNYEKIAKFDPSVFAGIILDESSILKGRFGVTRQELNQFAAHIPFRLCGTATPAPNDFEELIYHAEFLGIITEGEAKANFFTQDGNSSNKFRLKRHAVNKFWQWVASWAVAVRRPSDIGHSDDGFQLPKLNIIPVNVEIPTDEVEIDTLFVVEAKGINEQRNFRRATLDLRIQAAAELVNGTDDQWAIWSKYNPESEGVTAAIPGCVEVTGSDSVEHKERWLLGFAEKECRVISTKAEIAGFGMNWQSCHKTILLGWDNSYEQFYQLTRRFWRQGQNNDVDVYIVTTAADGAIIENMRRKETQAEEMYTEIIRNINMWSDLSATVADEDDEYKPTKTMKVPSWVKSKQSVDGDGAGWFLYDIAETIPFYINGELESALTLDGEPQQVIVIPSWIKGVQHESY